MAAVVGKRGGKPKATDTVMRPCQPLARRFMNDHELARGGGWDGHRNPQGNRGGRARRRDRGLKKSDEDG